MIMHHVGVTISWPDLWASADFGEEPAAEPAAALEPAAIDLRRRCRARATSTGQQCQRWPMNGSDLCAWHGRAPQVKDKAARVAQEREARALAVRMIGEVDLAKYADPFDALEFVTSYSYAFAERLAKVVAAIPDDQLRYEGKLGEQLRGEVSAMQRALSDAGRVATDSLKLGLAERRAKLHEHTVDVVQRALTMAIQASGADLLGQDRAMTVLRRELKAVSGG
jgi:hypothetical protein